MHNEVIHIGDIPVKVYTDGGFSRTVLAVHGFGGSKDSLAIEGLAERLCPVGFRVAAPDLPCHGERTEPESRLSPENCISEIMTVERSFRRNMRSAQASAERCCCAVSSFTEILSGG